MINRNNKAKTVVVVCSWLHVNKIGPWASPESNKRHCGLTTTDLYYYCKCFFFLFFPLNLLNSRYEFSSRTLYTNLWVPVHFEILVTHLDYNGFFNLIFFFHLGNRCWAMHAQYPERILPYFWHAVRHYLYTRIILRRVDWDIQSRSHSNTAPAYVRGRKLKIFAAAGAHWNRAL